MRKSRYLSEETKRKIGEANKGRIISPETRQKLRNARKGKSPMLGKHHSEETKEKMSKVHKNITNETRNKMSESQKGKIAWNKDIPHTEETKKKISEKLKGKNHPLYGKHQSEEMKRKISKTRKGKFLGSKSGNWKGGITTVNNLIRSSIRYTQWRQDCFIRDDFTCQKCGDNIGGNLNVHHKKQLFNLIREAQQYMPLLSWYDACMLYRPIWDIKNGITLCEKCHQAIPASLKNKTISKTNKGGENDKHGDY